MIYIHLTADVISTGNVVECDVSSVMLGGELQPPRADSWLSSCLLWLQGSIFKALLFLAPVLRVWWLDRLPRRGGRGEALCNALPVLF